MLTSENMIENKKKPILLLNKQSENKFLFVYKQKKQKTQAHIGLHIIPKKIKKKRYRFSKQLKKLKISYDFNKHRLFNLLKVIKKLKRQNSSAAQLIKKAKLKISWLTKQKNNKDQYKKLNLYKYLVRRLKLLRKTNRFKIISYTRKKHLYKHYQNEAENKKISKSKKKKKKTKIKLFYGVLKVLTIKRNIFITLADMKGNVRASVSSGLLKVKGRKRQALHIVKATGQKIVSLIFKHRMRKLFVFLRGRAYRKKKKTLTHVFSKVKKFEFLKINRPAPRCHNGCRSSKKRRK